MNPRKWLLLGAMVVLCLGAGAGQSADTAQPGDEIVNKLLDSNARRNAALQAYQGMRVYELEYQGFPAVHKHAQMTVRVIYHYPHQRELTIVSESGSKVLLNHVLHKLIAVEQETSGEKEHADSEMNRVNYRFQYLGQKSAQGRDCYLLQVIPLRENKLLYDGKIWVDKNDFAIVQIDAQPAKPPSAWISQTRIEHEYGKIGEFWLPLRNRSTSKVRLGGKAVLSIAYQDYAITDQRTASLHAVGGQ